MNGRIYDPVLGQFMQPDNFIQTPEDYIGYDRYSYCRGNPFKFTDPSGELLDYGSYSRMWDMASAAVAADGYRNTREAYWERTEAMARESGGIAMTPGNLSRYGWLYGAGGVGASRDAQTRNAAGGGQLFVIHTDGTIELMGSTDLSSEEGYDVFYKLDANGRPESALRFTAGTVIDYYEQPINIYRTDANNNILLDANGNQLFDTYTNTILEINGDAAGIAIFEFVAHDDATIEWGHIKTGADANGLNYVSTTGQEGWIASNGSIFNNIYRSTPIREMIHSHPWDAKGYTPIYLAGDPSTGPSSDMSAQASQLTKYINYYPVGTPVPKYYTYLSEFNQLGIGYREYP